MAVEIVPSVVPQAASFVLGLSASNGRVRRARRFQAFMGRERDREIARDLDRPARPRAEASASCPSASKRAGIPCNPLVCVLKEVDFARLGGLFFGSCGFRYLGFWHLLASRLPRLGFLA